MSQINSIGKKKFTIKEFADKFGTVAWSESKVTEPSSSFRAFLLSLPDSDAETETLSLMSMQCLGLLWCQGKPYNKAELLFECLNPPQDNQNQEKMAATDKEWSLILPRLLRIATQTTIEFKHPEEGEEEEPI